MERKRGPTIFLVLNDKSDPQKDSEIREVSSPFVVDNSFFFEFISGEGGHSFKPAFKILASSRNEQIFEIVNYTEEGRRVVIQDYCG